jgi:ubiquitin-protein ligase
MAGSNRLLKEYKEILHTRSQHSTSSASVSSSSLDIVLFPPDDSNLYAWSAHILGPPDTPYADHWFTLKINVPKQYPLAPPKVVFVTRGQLEHARRRGGRTLAAAALAQVFDGWASC